MKEFTTQYLDCPKCGLDGGCSDLKFVPATKAVVQSGLTIKPAVPEHLRIGCIRCAYFHLMRPKDAQPVSEQPSR